MARLVRIRSKAADDSNGSFGQRIFVGHAGADTTLEHEMVRHFPNGAVKNSGVPASVLAAARRWIEAHRQDVIDEWNRCN